LALDLWIHCSERLRTISSHGLRETECSETNAAIEASFAERLFAARLPLLEAAAG
jgi:hypothetical protein